MKHLAAIALLLALTGCNSIPRPQKGGSSGQSFPPIPASSFVATTQQSAPAPMQIMHQPENPEGVSTQLLHRTVTTTSPDGSVVTTVERAETTVGGSQDMAAIIKEAVGADQLRALLLALIMGFTAFLCRHPWPFVAVALAVGAVVVAVFGIAYALAFGGIGLGAVVAYYIARAQLAPLS
jgi:predicted RND superfamily exporter protein